MKRLKYKFTPNSLYAFIQSIQTGPHAQTDENWSGKDFSPVDYRKPIPEHIDALEL